VQSARGIELTVREREVRLRRRDLRFGARGLAADALRFDARHRRALADRVPAIDRQVRDHAGHLRAHFDDAPRLERAGHDRASAERARRNHRHVALGKDDRILRSGLLGGRRGRATVLGVAAAGGENEHERKQRC